LLCCGITSLSIGFSVPPISRTKSKRSVVVGALGTGQAPCLGNRAIIHLTILTYPIAHCLALSRTTMRHAILISMTVRGKRAAPHTSNFSFTARE
jgi:hypothetical protein